MGLDVANSSWLQRSGLVLWFVTGVFFLCAPFLFFSGMGKAAQTLDARVQSAAQSDLAPEIRQRSIPEPMLVAVSALLQRSDLGLTYITVRNADRVILASNGALEEALDWLPPGQARQWRGVLYRLSSDDSTVALHQSGDIVGFIDYGIGTRHVLAALPIWTWLVLVSALAALVFLVTLFPLVGQEIQARFGERTGAARVKPAQPTTKPRSPDSAANELQLSDRLGVGYLSVDAQGVIADANTNAARLLGFELRRLAGQDLDSLLVLEDAQGGSVDSPLQRCLQGEPRPVRTRAWMRRRDGKLMGMEMHAGVISGVGEVAASMLFWEASDDMSTRREHAEQAALAQVLLEHGEQAALLTNSSGQVLEANAAAANLFASSVEQIKTLPLAALLPEPFAQQPLQELENQPGVHTSRDGAAIATVVSCRRIRWQAKPAYLVLVHARGSAPERITVAQESTPLPTMSYHDDLTGLASRRHLMEQMASRFDHDAEVAPCLLLLVDIVNFKQINLGFDREVGDQALLLFGRQISAALEAGDTAVRLGGDEFAVLLCGDEVDEAVAANQAQTLLQACERPLKVAGISLDVNVDIGMSAAPLDAASPAELLQHAEAALYTAKAAGRHEPVLYAPGMNSSGASHSPGDSSLHHALAADAVELDFLPITHAGGQRPVAAGLVALAWQSPGEDRCGDDALWALAGRSGLAESLAAWCIRRIAQTQAGWRDMGLALVPAFLPLPAKLMQLPELGRVISMAVARYHIPQGSLVLYLTGELAGVIPAALPGVRIAVEIGLNESLSTMADFVRLPSAIAAQLPDDAQAVARAKALGAYARRHAKFALAGPVDRDEQRSALIATDVNLIHGPLVGAAMTPRQFGRFVAQHKTRPI